MRVIGGMFRHRPLYAPPGRDVRPTPARAREALFSILGGTLGGHCFLDLFAGAGTMGLEAVSRGAERAIFVEQDRKALSALQRNIRALGCEGRCEVIELPAGRIGPPVFERCTVIFLDPPYGREPDLPNLGSFLEGSEHPPPVIYQREARFMMPGGREVCPPWIPDTMTLLDERRYGRTVFSFYSEEEN